MISFVRVLLMANDPVLLLWQPVLSVDPNQCKCSLLLTENIRYSLFKGLLNKKIVIRLLVIVSPSIKDGY